MKDMLKIGTLTLILGIFTLNAYGSHVEVPGKFIPEVQQYRDLTNKIRTAAEFMVPQPGMKSSVTYFFEFDQPIYPEPILGDTRTQFHLDQTNANE